MKLNSRQQTSGNIDINMSPANVTAADITTLASKAGLKLEDGHDADYGVLMSALENSIATLDDDRALMPRPDLNAYPRTDVHVPEDSEGGGWAMKVGGRNALLRWRVC